MSRGLLIRLLISLLFCAILFTIYLNAQNELTELRIRIPQLEKEVCIIAEENTRLQYAIDRFENPQNLMELSRHHLYSHLKHPFLKDVIVLPSGEPLGKDKAKQ